MALDYKGEVYAISRWTGQKAKDVKAKLGDPSSLPSVEETKATISERMTGLINRYIRDAETALQSKEAAITTRKAQMKERHCAARQTLIENQAERWADETVARAGKLRGGIAGLWDWMTGKSKKIAKENEAEAYQAVRRDDQEREEQRQQQLEERRALQSELSDLQDRHADEVAALRADIAIYLDLGGHDGHHDLRADDRAHQHQPNDRGHDHRDLVHGDGYDL